MRLPGLKYVKDKDGNVLDEWVSTSEPHIIRNLTVGETYTLSETIAPDGYKIAQSIDFKIKDTGEVQNVVMYDELLPSSGGVNTSDDTSTGAMAALVSVSALGMVSYGSKKGSEEFPEPFILKCTSDWYKKWR